MGLELDPAAQRALDLAKRSLPEGTELDARILAAALCHSGELEGRYKALADKLPPPTPLRPEVPAKVPVAKPLRPVLGHLAKRAGPVAPEQLLQAILDSEAGRALLDSVGIGPEVLTEGGNRIETAWRDSLDRQEAIDALSSFGRMLTVGEPPHCGVVEMERTIRALIRALTKMRRRNAILLGQAGTGKSAVIYELARRLVRGDPSIPEPLRDHDIFELSPTFLRSGASMLGQYEERVKTLLEVLRAHPKIILFVDEIHSFFQSSIHQRGPFTDANESFKGALARGEIRCLGCTTPAEYRHYIEPDPPLARRFNLVRLEPPSREATLRILRARRPRMEEYYAPLRIPDAILERAVRLSDDYLTRRFQPDKAIQLLDDACAWCVTSNPRPAEVSEEALWQVLEDRIGHSLIRHERLTEEEVFDRLRRKIVGQDETLRSLARGFVASLGGWTKPSGPRGVYFFCGPTGVGKTESALRLAEILGGGKRALVEIDCNTLQGSGRDSGPAINVLLGAPPGYAGYVRGQGGALSRIRDEPESVVLFDEIEKANPGVGKVLLQILDDGRVDDTDGNPMDFRRSFIVFTTNAGCVYDERHIGIAREDASPEPRVDLEAVKSELRSLGYGEEFLGRIDDFFVFRALDAPAIRIVIERQLKALGRTATERGYDLVWDPALVEHLSEVWQPRFGVRHLTTILRHRIVEQLSVADAQGELRGVQRIRLEAFEPAGGDGQERAPGAAGRERSGDVLTIRVA